MAEYVYEYEVFPLCGRFVGVTFEFGTLVTGETKAEVMRSVESSLRIEVERSLLREGCVPEASVGNAPSHAAGCIMLARIDVPVEIGGMIPASEAARVLGITRARVSQLIKAGKLDAVSRGNSKLITCLSVADRLRDKPSAGRPCKEGVSTPSAGRAALSFGLLELLQCRVGCVYISDLKLSSSLPFIRHALRSIDPDAFGVDEWNDAVRYITGKDVKFFCGKAAARYLTDFRPGAGDESRRAEGYTRSTRSLGGSEDGL